MQTNFPPFAKLGFGLDAVALYFVPDHRAPCLKSHQAIEMPRDNSLGEKDPNVIFLRAIERAANEAREAALVEAA